MGRRSSRGLSFLLILAMIIANVFSFGNYDVVRAEEITETDSNLVQNGGLESWDSDTKPTGWSKTENITKEETIVHSGNYSARQMAGTKDIGQDIEDIQPGEEYTIEYWYLDNDPTAKCRPWMYWRDTDNQSISDNQSEFRPNSYSSDSSDWQKFSVTVTAPENASKLHLEVRTYKDNGTGYIYYDNFSVTANSTVVPDKVSDVTASPIPGAVEEGTLVTLTTSTENATILYAVYSEVYDQTNGYEEYSDPIEINGAVTIAAKATKEGMEDSDVVEFQYTIKETLHIITIEEARALDLEEEVMVEGIVTSIPGSFGSNSFYIQDETSGVLIYTNDDISADIGNTVKITGETDEYSGKFEIFPATIEIVSTNTSEPEPEEITIEGLIEDNEAELVEVKNVEVKSISSDSYDNAYITITDGTNEATVKLDSRTGEDINDVTVEENDIIDVVGIVEQYNDSYRILIRRLEDITEIDLGTDTEAPVINHTNVLEGNIYLDLEIEATVTDDRSVESVKVFYRIKDTETYTELDMTLSDSQYETIIPKEDLDTAGLEYYIQATDGTNVTTSPVNTDSPFEITISNTDVEGPVITSLEPEDGYVFADASEVQGIRAEFMDSSQIDETSVKLSLDGVDVTSSATYKENAISYMIDEQLEDGSHSATVEVSDILGNETVRTWTFTIGDEEYKYYRGQLHSHTNYSDGTGTADEAFAWARDKGNADFFAITDHSNWFDNDEDTSNENITDVSQSTSSTWKNMHADADEYNEDGKFIAIAGYEMTWSGSTGGWGHINTFNTPWFASRSNSKMNLEAYYSHITEDTDSISQLNHPGKTFGDFNDFGFYSEGADNVVSLIEVGNGEGPIRGSGYFPSYEYYTRALDKGWHVAPSNNQDNHKGNWITANEARTVVLAKELTRESIYQGIRELKVYASEDSNLEIMYRINGEIMGSSLDEPENLNVSIRVSDPDTEDNIKSIKLISDGGVESAEKTFDSNDAVWEFELDPQYTYYYVRIDQDDGDIAVTAPIWTAKMVPVGLSGITSSQDIVETNTSVDLDATVYNNTDEILSEATVSFYKDEIKSGNKIGEATVENIGQGSTDKASIAWTPDSTGIYKIYATTTINIDGVDKASTVSTIVEVMDKEDIIKVVIDAGHMNHYVSGSYEGKMTGFKEMLKDKKMMAVEDSDGLTTEDLDDADLLIITSPQPTDDSRYNLLKSKLSDEEIDVVKGFVSGGGSLIITSRADYKDGEEDYQNSVQANKVLEAIGANLRINDDEVIDGENNEGQEYRLMFTNYTSSKFDLTSGSEVADYNYSFYSGCSVVLDDEGNDENVDFLVKGHSTTETKDADNESDSVAVEKGEVYVLAAEELQGGGKVIVSGTTFFSDFEVSGDNINSNIQITKNILEWLKAEEDMELSTIADVRIDANEDGIPDNLGEKYMIEGRVTSESEAYTQSQGRKNAFFEVIYVQDATGGITVFGVSEKEIPLGAKVRIIGEVEQYQGDTELEIENETTDVVVLDDATQIVEPIAMTTGESMLEENEGWLTQVQGIVTRIVTEGDNAIYLDDGSGEARVLLQGYIDDGSGDPEKLGKWDETIEIGDSVSAIGLASEDPIGHRLRVRNAAEIVKEEDPNIYPVQIIEVKTTDINDEETVEFAENNIVVVRASMNNVTEEDVNALVIIKVVDADDRSYGLGFIPAAQLKSEGNNTFSLGFRIHGIEKGTHIAKVYVWNNWNDRNPLSEVGTAEFTVK